ncbi:aminotransferase class IV [Dehalococcoidia bacterium]|nr:aminotransferase class IV [Dehalococcoidia bacterium]
MPAPTIYLNGHLIAHDEAAISVADHGLLYGHALFETIRTYQGKPFRLNQHLQRLERGIIELDIPPCPYDLKAACTALINSNEICNGRIRITLTAGEGPDGPDARPSSRPTVLITALPLETKPAVNFEHGYSAGISSVRRNSLSPASRLKTTNLMESILARREAIERGFDQAIMLNEKRCIAECAYANIFFVAYRGLVTPSVDSGLLPGITRDAVFELSLAKQIPIDERWVNIEEIWDAEEIFVTSSIIGLVPITSVNDRPVNKGFPGRITRTLAQAYDELISQELDLPN